jgi:phosphohistidine swiveling domain-containing protein
VYHLGTKAETLKLLLGKLEHAVVLPQYAFTVGDWHKQKDAVKAGFLALDWKDAVIVRSSSLSEDTSEASQAGKYESIADVSGLTAFCEAVEKVIVSYDDDNEQNQILVQPMLTGVKICGVAFTLDPNTLGNYYVINYDENGSTNAVTGGAGTENRLYYHFKDSAVSEAPKEMRKLVLTLAELERLFEKDNLDVEFALDEQGTLYILQVRALCVRGTAVDRQAQGCELERIEKKIKRDQSPKPFLCGKKTIYSVMTDWNPAEMIGIRPKPLALSLYREIITDSVWAYQRDNYGYRNLRSFPLMVDFCGLPYIDVRVSFNSFVPAELDEQLSEKLVNYYIDRLTDNPKKHDKAEFEIVFSCYTLDLSERIQILKKYGFLESEIKEIVDALRNVTNHIIDHKDGLWRKDYAKIEKLNRRYHEIMESDLGDIEKVYWLLEDCKRYGTLPFAGLARAAFIAVQLLQSLVTEEIITRADYDAFMNSVNTVNSDMNHDFFELSREAFLRKYGHLRPGTYDINSLRYDEAPELYFEWNKQPPKEGKEKAEFRLSLQQLNKLKEKLSENGLTNDILELMDFIKTVIEGREYGKFAFTRNLSKAIQLIGEIGQKEGISKEECAFLHIHTIYELYASTKDVRTNLLYSIGQGKKDYELTKSITLPPVIVAPEDVMQFYYPDSEPNYITCNKVCSSVYLLETVANVSQMEEKIVLIPSADPGYDWIFSHKIKGFITMFGGANSHMAIRAGELGIPAVVGVGKKKFEQYKNASVIEIDAQGKTIKVLR